MTCKIANEISLEILLESWGYHKIKNHRGGHEAFYENPIREDSTPSFLINTKKNVWVDFGLIPSAGQKAKGGKVVDLIMEIQKTDVKGALNWLRNNTNNFDVESIKNKIESVAYIEPVKRYKFRKQKEIFSYGLKDYLEERKVSLEIAKTHVKEIRYYDEEFKKEYFSLGIKNNSGGYSLRNNRGHIILAPNDIRYIPSNVPTKTIIIFEGMFDFLSYLMIKNTSVLNDDVIILNTLAFIKRAVDEINKMDHIESVISFLDNPKDNPRSKESMDRAISILCTSNRNIFLANETFKAYEDLAAYWQTLESKDPILLKELS